MLIPFYLVLRYGVVAGEEPEFWGEVQPPASLKGLDIPSRRAVFVPWKPSRRPAFGMGSRLFVEEPMLSTGLHFVGIHRRPISNNNSATFIPITNRACVGGSRMVGPYERPLTVRLPLRQFMHRRTLDG